MEEDNKRMRISSSTSTTSTDHEAAAAAIVAMDDDQILLISQFYPDLYTNHQLPKQDDSSKTRRKRRKRSKLVSKEETSNDEVVALMKKRKLSVEQVKLLELNFGSEHKLESERKDRIASELGLDPRQVAVWFQNRRARWKNKKLEEEYSKLKSAHDGVTVEKCNLETEVMKLKQQLCEANKEIQRLSVLHTYSDGKTSKSIGSPSSSSSSFSMVIDSHFPEDLVIDGFDQSLLYSPAEYNWVNLFGF